jgi:hypothetical protein
MTPPFNGPPRVSERRLKASILPDKKQEGFHTITESQISQIKNILDKIGKLSQKYWEKTTEITSSQPTT